MTIVVVWGQECSKGAWCEGASRCHVGAREPAREHGPRSQQVPTRGASRPVWCDGASRCQGARGAMEPGEPLG